MKTIFITLIVFLAIVFFGMASSARAFFVPISSTVASIFGGSLIVGIKAPMNGSGMVMGVDTPKIQIDHQQTKCARFKDQKDQEENQTRKQVRNFVILPLLVPSGGGNLSYF